MDTLIPTYLLRRAVGLAADPASLEGAADAVDAYMSDECGID
jgi:hypothetical protein